MESPVNTVDVVIIGGGPAGISAAAWCSELGLECALVEESNVLGGQLRYIYNRIDNYLGLSSENGLEMLSYFERSLTSRNFVRRIGIKAKSIDIKAMEVILAETVEGEDRLSGKAMIIATGVRRRVLGIPGEIELRGRGVLESGVRDKAQVSGKRVLIIGGGDAAFENALILSDAAASVSIAYRRAEPSARPEFLDAADKRKNIEYLPSTIVSEICGGVSVESVELRDIAGRVRIMPIDAVLIRIGVEPNSDLVRGSVDLDDSGYVKVNEAGETSVPRIYAVGDIAHRYSPTLSTAVGTAATAAKTLFRSLRNPLGL